MSELETALGTIFLTRLATGNLLKILIPSINRYLKQMKETSGLADGVELSEVEKT